MKNELLRPQLSSVQQTRHISVAEVIVIVLGLVRRSPGIPIRPRVSLVPPRPRSRHGPAQHTQHITAQDITAQHRTLQDRTK